MEFTVRELSNKPDTIYVRYDCACGCKPGTEHRRDSPQVEFEHCCCGNVHFVGMKAKNHLEKYLGERREKGLDDDLSRYTVAETEIPTPWGYNLTVAYALPDKPRAH